MTIAVEAQCSPQWQNKVMAKINRIAEIIRQHKRISFSALCVKACIGSSTLYGYKNALLDLCKDIRYEKGVFTVVTEASQK